MLNLDQMELQICSKVGMRKLELAAQFYTLEYFQLYKNAAKCNSQSRLERIESISVYNNFEQLLILQMANGFLFFKLHEFENLRFRRTSLVLSISGKRYKLKFDSHVFGAISLIKEKLLLAKIATNFYANPSHLYQFYKELDHTQ